MGGLSLTRVRLQRSQKEVEYLHNGHRVAATTFFQHSENARLADNVSICFLAEIWKHDQVREIDGRDEASAEKQGNGRICAHWTEKGDFTSIMGGRMGGRGKREEVSTKMLLDSGTWRRTATRLRVEQGENRVKELRMPNSAAVGAPQRTTKNGVETGVYSPLGRWSRIGECVQTAREGD
jgi:hypothetical protein